MKEKLINSLENVPYIGKDSYNELSKIIGEKLKTRMITCRERERLYYELNIIKKTGAAKLFLFALNALKGFSTDECCFLVKENNCYINYLLRLTSVNPVQYGLPFELFFNSEREGFPRFCFYVKNGTKERLLNNIGDYYKEARLIKGNDSNCRYFIDTAGKTKSDQENDGSTRTGALPSPSADESAKRGLFEFDILEYKSNKIVGKDFSADEIYNEAIRTVAYKPTILSMKPFEKIGEINDILSSTDGKLIYQEQVIEILRKGCGFDPVTADCIRKAICTKKPNFNDEIAEILHNRYGADGDEFFKYLLEYGLYAVSEGYVIAKMKNDVIREEE